MNNKVFRILEVVVGLLGIALPIASNWIGEKKMADTIAECVKEELAKANK